jgi:hypothetical protein
MKQVFEQSDINRYCTYYIVVKEAYRHMLPTDCYYKVIQEGYNLLDDYGRPLFVGLLGEVDLYLLSEQEVNNFELAKKLSK